GVRRAAALHFRHQGAEPGGRARRAGHGCPDHLCAAPGRLWHGAGQQRRDADDLRHRLWRHHARAAAYQIQTLRWPGRQLMSNIRLSDVRKAYTKSAPPAVDRLNLEIPKSDFLCLLGPSGCGKTTTLRMIAGLEHPTEGRISVGERMLVSVDDGIYVPAEKRDMGLVFQNYALWPHMSVAQNVEFGLKLRKVAKPERDRIVADVLEKLGIARYR